MVIAVAWLLAAASAAAIAVLFAVAPSLLGFVSDPWASTRLTATIVFSATALVCGSFGLELMRLQERGRRTVVILLWTLAVGAVVLAYIPDGYGGWSLGLAGVVSAAAIYLSRPPVKSAFARAASAESREEPATWDAAGKGMRFALSGGFAVFAVNKLWDGSTRGFDLYTGAALTIYAVLAVWMFIVAKRTPTASK
jgi:hypothetical protein